MVTLKGSVLVMFSTLSLALASPAQAELSVEGQFVAGSQVTITYSNEELANEAIYMEIDDGGRHDPQAEYILMLLDGEGEGEVNWTLPQWDLANFNAPGAQVVTRMIAEGGGAN